MTDLDYEPPERVPSQGIPWRSLAALACIVGVIFGGSVSVDRYTLELRRFIVPTVFAVVGLAFAWSAVRSGLRHERVLGWSTFVVLALLCLFMLCDRASIWLGWRGV